MKEENRKEHETIFKLLDDQANGKVSNKLFFFTIAFVITALIGLTAYTGNLSNIVTKNTVYIEKFEVPVRGL